ncbi:hypothetical protein ACEPAF_7151 [Sanghuangporus sanghuang]|uniref:Cytochrome c oxidase copper chaperone n=1 Tax=Sanghuangporus baumii TaxID=108892 RepID=A0A9Q5I5S3_SANBA|nr:hypothetical protein A7U60_g361 [Sanghuangporus baumii]
MLVLVTVGHVWQGEQKLSTWWGGSSPETKPAADAGPVNPLNPQGIKPCCACPDTKRARDECYMQNDADVANEKCKALVAAHVQCMRGYGFEV